MDKTSRYLLIFCFVSIAAILGLQIFWLESFYKTSRQTFDKEANMAFEDALKKDFSLRCDTVEQLLADHFMDSTRFTMTSHLDSSTGYHKFVLSAPGRPAFSYFSTIVKEKLDTPKFKGIPLRRLVAERLAFRMRTEDLESGVIYYNIYGLGDFASEKMKKYEFDTLRFKPVLVSYLHARNIYIPFKIHLAKKDTILNTTDADKRLSSKFPVITKAYPTYTTIKAPEFIRIMFENPFRYVASMMSSVLISSIILILLVSFGFWLLLKNLFNEKKLSELKNEFISNITHEFKTPIATASVAIEAFDKFEVLKDASKTQHYLSLAKNELIRLSGLVDKILQISIYQSAPGIRKEKINIDETILELVDFHAKGRQSENVLLEYKNESNSNVLLADKMQFQHALNNVIDNAVKYSHTPVLIKIRCYQQDDFMIIAISDNGRGISQQELPMVFKRFYRSPGVINLNKGYGLGLSYVKKIIEQHQGWCKIESKVSVGTTMFLAWPL